MKQLLFLLLPAIAAIQANAQGTKPPAKYTITKYERISNDPFKTVPEGKLVMDYYCTSGLSSTNRIWYEIVLVGNRLTLSFHSFEAENYRKIDYLREYKITDAAVAQLERVLRKANLKQKNEGIPVPETGAVTKEVLIARHKDINIGGGRFNHTTYGLGVKQSEVDKVIAAERASNTSIDGDFDGVVAAMKKQFTTLDSLMRAAKR